jgi:hypothetical protein
MLNRFRIASLVAMAILAVMLGGPGPAAASPSLPADGPSEAVFAWSGYSAQALSVGGPLASADVQLGIVHVAMHDTVVALGLRAHPFVSRLPASPGASAPAAIAAAAYTVLIERLPTRRAFLDATYQRYLAGIPHGAAEDRGVELGRRVAATVLAWQARDGWDSTVPYVPSAASPARTAPYVPPPTR